jgi:hypothetical protein
MSMPNWQPRAVSTRHTPWNGSSCVYAFQNVPLNNWPPMVILLGQLQDTTEPRYKKERRAHPQVSERISRKFPNVGCNVQEVSRLILNWDLGSSLLSQTQEASVTCLQIPNGVLANYETATTIKMYHCLGDLEWPGRMKLLYTCASPTLI